MKKSEWRNPGEDEKNIYYIGSKENGSTILLFHSACFWFRFWGLRHMMPGRIFLNLSTSVLE